MNELPKWAIRLSLGAVTVLAFIMALNLTGWKWDPLNRAEADRKGREVAEEQAALNAESAAQVEHVYRTETIVRTQAEEAAHVVYQSPGSDAPLPADVLDAWRAGIDGMRERSEGAGDPGS